MRELIAFESGTLEALTLEDTPDALQSFSKSPTNPSETSIDAVANFCIISLSFIRGSGTKYRSIDIYSLLHSNNQI